MINLDYGEVTEYMLMGDKTARRKIWCEDTYIVSIYDGDTNNGETHGLAMWISLIIHDKRRIVPYTPSYDDTVAVDWIVDNACLKQGNKVRGIINAK